MIRTVADFLLKLKEEESRRLDSVDLKHGPTIGDMYEGLSKDLLGRAIPESLGLQLVSGFVTDGMGGISGQIDCMLVKGRGSELPYTGKFKWHVKDVIAVFEIKKSLHGADLADAFDHLRTVRDLEANYIQSQRDQSEIVDIDSAERAFAETTGLISPAPEEIKHLDLLPQLILHTLILEQVGVIRVIFGYDGFRTESGFRQSLINHLDRHIGVHGFGPGSFPQLIIAGGYSLGKANGQPFSAPLQDGWWPFYFSSAINPLQLLLEFIWTRLARDFEIGNLWGEDLAIEALHAFLLGSVEEKDGQLGWNCKYIHASNAELASVADYDEWQPANLTLEQFTIICELCAGQVVRVDDDSLHSYLKTVGTTIEEFTQSLLGTHLVAMAGNEIQLITIQCQPVILPNGDFVAGENNTGRMTRWLNRYQEKLVE